MSAIPAIVVHGGAGRRPSRAEREDDIRRALAAAVELAAAALAAGGSALDAAVAAVCRLEDEPVFNAGVGSVLTSEGTAELDAAVMEGSQGRAGAVAAVSRIAHPVQAARLVMERSPHVLLTGPGAERFAEHNGAALVDPDHHITEAQLRRWRRRLRPVDSTGTVGAVVRDGTGALAAATSTGGMAGQLPGRVGDTPLIGAGTYADDATCAVSASGDGEALIRHVAAHQIAALVEHREMALDEACATIVEGLGTADGTGGVIALGPDGEPAVAFTTECFHRATQVGYGDIRVAIGDD